MAEGEELCFRASADRGSPLLRVSDVFPLLLPSAAGRSAPGSAYPLHCPGEFDVRAYVMLWGPVRSGVSRRA
jgi:hypothetical protein